MASCDYLPPSQSLPTQRSCNSLHLSESPFSRLAANCSCSDSCSEDTRVKNMDPLGKGTMGSQGKNEVISATNQMPVQSPPVSCAGKIEPWHGVMGEMGL